MAGASGRHGLGRLGKTFAAISGVEDVGLQFSEPAAVDTNLLWVTSMGDWRNTVFGFSPERLATPGTDTGAPSVVLTEPVPAATNDPSAIAFTPFGDMWTGNCSGFFRAAVPPEILRFQLTATNSPAADVRITLPFPDNSYNCVIALTASAAGDVYVAMLDLRDSTLSHVLRFAASQLTESGAPVPQATLSSSTYFGGIWDIVLDSTDNVYVAAYRSNVVARLSPNQLMVDDPASFRASSSMCPARTVCCLVRTATYG